MSRLLLAAASLWRRELVRFFRQRSRVIGSLLTPLVFWLLFAAGYGGGLDFGSTSSGSDVGSFAFFFPGTVTLILLFTSIFTNISVIQDRKEGFLQGVLVAPIPRLAIVLGKVLGGASIAMLQAMVFLLLALVGRVGISLADPVTALGAMALLSISITALGFVFAWRLDSIQAFHGIMNLVLMPMWLLSGALFPAENLPAALDWAMRLNPVAYGLSLLRHGLGVPGAGLPDVTQSLAVSAAIATILTAAAVIVASARSRT